MTADDRDLSIEVLAGTPNEEELAALMAVVSEAYTTEAAAAVADDSPAPSAWTLSTHRLRRPLARGSVWGRFEG